MTCSLQEKETVRSAAVGSLIAIGVLGIHPAAGWLERLKHAKITLMAVMSTVSKTRTSLSYQTSVFTILQGYNMCLVCL